MRSILRLRSFPRIGIVLGGWILFANTTLAATGIPDLLFHDTYPGYPIWVSAESALNAERQPDEALFDEGYRGSIAQLSSSAKEGECIQLMAPILRSMIIDGATDPRIELSTALRAADWVFLGRVVGHSGGFRGGEPGTMLEVELIETIHGIETGFESYFVFFPAGRFFLGSTEICKDAWQYANLPDLGAEVLILINLSERNLGRLLWYGGDSGLITFDLDGSVSLPDVYKESNPDLEGVKKEDLLGWIESLFGLSEKGDE